jgi:hypothetical protein
MYRTLVVLALAASSTPAARAAQAIAPTQGPADPTVAVPTVKYESAFGGYRPFREEKLGDWRALNEDVARAGGHIGIMGGAAGHGSHRDTKPEAKPGSGKAAEPHSPVRAAPAAPASGGHKH